MSPNEPQTFGDLRRLLTATPRGDWPSRVNPSLSRSQALDILIRAIHSHADDDPITARDGGLMVRNILRECRSRP